MKNKISYILLGLIVSFSFINNVFAEGLDFSVSAKVAGDNTNVAAGTETSIDVSVSSDGDIDSCVFEIVKDSGIEFISQAGMNNYVANLTDNSISVSRTNTDVSFVSGQNILQLKYKINESGKITIKTTECKSSVDTSGSYEDISFDFKVSDASEDTSLKNLVVKGGTLAPAFISTQTQYVVSLDGPEFSLELTANNSNYQDKIVVKDSNGKVLDPNNIKFSDTSGQGMMELNVLVNDGTKYVLLVKYEQEGLDGQLKTLKVHGKEIKLQEGKFDYSITVDKDVKSVKIDAVLVDNENFKFAENNGPTIFLTPDGRNVYPLIVEPVNSSIGAAGVTYTITVIREGVVDNTTSDVPSGGGQSNNNNNNNQNVSTNPSTGISMFLMAFILIVSLFGSVYLYHKNMEGYNK